MKENYDSQSFEDLKHEKKSPFSDLSFLNTRMFIVFGHERMNVILCWPGHTNPILLFVLIIK